MRTLLTFLGTTLAFGMLNAAQARTCEVSYISCTADIGGVCVGRKRRNETVQARDRFDACERVRNRRGLIKDCSANCRGGGGGGGGPRWALLSNFGNGSEIASFGRGPDARRACQQNLRRRCRNNRNLRAQCVGLRRGRVVAEAPQPQVCESRRGGRARWALVSRFGEGRELQSFGRGANARQDCQDELRRRCRNFRNLRAQCIGYNNGRQVNSAPQPGVCPRNR